jgi:penicillin-binding protein 2
MAMVTATIANRGISFEPRLVHRVLDQDGNDVYGEDGKMVAPHEPKVRANLNEAGISKEQIELIRRGMWKVVNEAGGTGRRAQVKNIEVAGKTGTAQFWRESNGKRVKDNHTWFITFAPYEQPKYAICVFVQGAKSGGGVSAPIAQKILEESLALEKGYDPGLAKLEPAVGSFAQIEAVDYKRTDVPAEMAPDPETADHTDEPPVPKKKAKQVRSRPDIRPDADQGGRVSAARAQPIQRPAEKRNFFQRFFGGRNRDNNQRPAGPPPRPGGR